MQIETILSAFVFCLTIALMALCCWGALRLIAGPSRKGGEGKRFGWCCLIALIIIVIRMVLTIVLNIPFDVASAVLPSHLVFNPLVGVEFVIILAAWFFLVRAIFDEDYKDSFYVALLTTIFIIIYNNTVIFTLGLFSLSPAQLPFLSYLLPTI